MNSYRDVVQSEINRVAARIRELEDQSEAHSETRAQIAKKIARVEGASSSGDTNPQNCHKILSHLRIEDEQTVEAERLVKHHLKERKKQLDILVEEIEALQDSSLA